MCSVTGTKPPSGFPPPAKKNSDAERERKRETDGERWKGRGERETEAQGRQGTNGKQAEAGARWESEPGQGPTRTTQTKASVGR